MEGLETHNVFLTNQHYARTLNVSGYMLEIKDIPGVRIPGRVSKKKQVKLGFTRACRSIEGLGKKW